MRFTLYAILPALLWTLLGFAWYELTGATSVGTVASVLLFLAWFLTAGVVGLYWAARIIRFALRAPRTR